MNQYLELLNKIKSCESNKNYIPQLEKLEAYIKGEITSQELLIDADGILNGIVYFTINKLLNHEERDIRYYVELPRYMYFNRGYAPCIRAGKIQNYEIRDNSIEIIGPKYQTKCCTSFSDQHWCEITGDFSQYPKGVMLYVRDWYRIIARYPNLYERIYNLAVNDYEYDEANGMTMEQLMAHVDEYLTYHINQSKEQEGIWLGKEEAEYIPKEVVNSIKFVIPIEYLTKDQVFSKKFGTFEQISKGIKPIEKEEKIAEQLTDCNEKEEKIVEQLTDCNEKEEIIRVGLGDLYDYMCSSRRKQISLGIDLDMQYMFEKSIHESSKEEAVSILADFILNYKGKDAQSHLSCLGHNSEIVNGRICDIPLVTFAKLNNPEIANQLVQLGAKDIETIQSENEELVVSIAQIFGYNQERKLSISNIKFVLHKIFGTNTEQSFKKRIIKK